MEQFKRQSTEQLIKELSQIPSAPTYSREVYGLISRTAKYLNKHLNREIRFNSYRSRNELRIYLSWNDNVNRPAGCYSGSIIYHRELIVGWKKHRKNISLANIKTFLQDLCRVVRKCIGLQNPVKRLKRMTDESGYVVATRGAKIFKMVPLECRIYIPVGRSLAARLKRVQMSHKSPVKRAAVYRYLSKRVTKDDLSTVIKHSLMEGDYEAQSVLNKVVDDLTTSCDSALRPRRF